MHKKISDVHLDGFSMTSVKAGDPPKILMRGIATSDDPMFYIFAPAEG